MNSGVIANAINDLIAQKSVSRGEVFLKKPIKEIYEIGYLKKDNFLIFKMLALDFS